MGEGEKSRLRWSTLHPFPLLPSPFSSPRPLFVTRKAAEAGLPKTD